MSSKNEMPIKYMKNKEGLRVHANNVKQTWVLMFNDQVVSESADAEEIIQHYHHLENVPCWIEIRGHYPEDGDEIGRRISNMLGEYFHKGAGIKKEYKNHGHRKEQILKVYFYKSMKLDFADGLVNSMDEVISPSFGPAGGIEIKMEIP